MRTIRYLALRLVCWLKGHDLETHRIRRGQMRGVAQTCRRCGTVTGFAKKKTPLMTVPKG